MPAEPKPQGLDFLAIDRSIKAGDNFYLHANNIWLKTNEIPNDRSAWGPTDAMVERTAKRIYELILDASKSEAPAGSDARKVGDYFASYMDEAQIEAKGLAPLTAQLQEIAAIDSVKKLSTYLGRELRADVDVLNNTNFYTPNLFGLWVAQDLKDPSRYAPYLLQGGLTLPEREYYLDASARANELRTKFEAHVVVMLKLAQIQKAEAKAKKIIALETAMAKVHASIDDTQDVQKGYNPIDAASLKKRAPGLDWDSYLAAAGLQQQGSFVLWQPKAITGLSSLVKKESLETWKAYLTLHAIEDASAYLPKAFGEERFAFFGRTLRGTPQQRERWKRGVAAVDGALGEVVGKLYVEKYFPASEKARAEAMVKNVIAAFDKRIDALAWMAAETKAQAKEKLKALKVGVGYPDKWRDYSKLDIVKGDAWGNARRAELFDYQDKLARLGQPVDRSEWVMNPQLVNAVNLPAMNAMNFPAAILQPPSFDSGRSAAMDYGAIGATIGHEICHSFDDQGAQFDATGRLQNWWTKADLEHFRASAEVLAQQYNSYKPLSDVSIDGNQTLSENMADLAGLHAAYDAYRLSLGGQPAPKVGGLDGDQQFFMSFAQSWLEKVREPALRQQLKTDVHAPAEFRAATVRNLDAWYRAFEVQDSEKMFLKPEQRVKIW
jgi:putative endopeptidase